MEKLTTAQMLEKLGFGDSAINQKGFIVGYTDKGDLITWNEGEEKPGTSDDKFTLYYPWVKNDVWVIRYEFVEFEEAQHAHTEEHKTVVCYFNDDQQYRFVHGEYGHFKQMANDGISLEDLTKAKWQIEN